MSFIRSAALDLVHGFVETPVSIEPSLGLSAELPEKTKNRAAWKRLQCALTDIEENFLMIKRDVGEMQSNLGDLKKEMLNLRNNMIAYSKAWKVGGTKCSSSAVL